MDINNMTIGQAREIAQMFGQVTKPDSGNPLIGQKIILRTYASGVHFGELVQQDGQRVVLKNARRLWKWKAKKGLALSAVAQHGLDPDYDNRVDSTVPTHVILDALECIQMTPEAIESIENIGAYRNG